MKTRHRVNLNGYTAEYPNGRFLWLGTKDSYGCETLELVVDEAWSGLTITATFVTRESATKVLVPPDGIVIVPPEATAAETTAIPGRIVFSGTAKGVQRISCDLLYRVLGHAPIDGAESRPTPNEWQQYVSEVQSIVNTAVPPDGLTGQVLTKTETGNAWKTPDEKPVKDGATFTPKVSPEGVLSWSNDKGLANPPPVNIKGPKGDPGKTPVKGVDYWTEQDKQEMIQGVLQMLPKWNGGVY